jgi:hypothetical protein
MPTTFPSDPNEATARINFWINGATTGGPFQGKRILPTKDKIKAKDINELRDQIELLIGHTHEYTDSSGGGGTTTCG